LQFKEINNNENKNKLRYVEKLSGHLNTGWA
jgi:hypothetical protein